MKYTPLYKNTSDDLVTFEILTFPVMSHPYSCLSIKNDKGRLAGSGRKLHCTRSRIPSSVAFDCWPVTEEEQAGITPVATSVSCPRIFSPFYFSKQTIFKSRGI